MAELVDALVSNTNAERRAGSIPALGTKNRKYFTFRFFLFSKNPTNLIIFFVKYLTPP